MERVKTTIRSKVEGYKWWSRGLFNACSVLAACCLLLTLVSALPPLLLLPIKFKLGIFIGNNGCIELRSFILLLLRWASHFTGTSIASSFE
jgi:hypothetical protein